MAAEVRPDRLSRFFTKTDDDYTVSKLLRDSVMFAVQNVIAAVPFSKLDLISCRNLLIYLEPEVQKKLIALFHFGLRDEGVLFLECLAARPWRPTAEGSGQS
jgi:two-component system, chemotaxis family, CheB/CheR fusion protein